MQSCAVIGCGPAGILATSCLRQSGLLVTCFELSSGAGGMWAIDSRKRFSDRGLPSPLFPAMRCVLPKDLMAFSDSRFDYTVPQFPHHSSVKDYLERYASAKGVAGLTRFNTKVQSVRFDDRDRLWKLVTVNISSGDVHEWSFDKVCVCTGQTQEPRFPLGLMQAMEPFKRAGGEVEHACHVKDFRALRHKRVVVIGDGVTAADYCDGLQQVGADVCHSSSIDGTAEQRAAAASGAGGTAAERLWRRAAPEVLYRRVVQRQMTNPRVKRLGALRRWEDGKALVFDGAAAQGPLRVPQAAPLEEHGAELVDNVDMILCATGFTQRFPFLHPDIRRIVEEESLPLLPLETANICTKGKAEAEGSPTSGPSARGLYLGTIWRSNPSLAFVGLQKSLLPPFLLYEVQARFVSYAFTRRLTLPATETEMLRRQEELEARHGMLLASPDGMRSSVYFDVLQQELGVSSRDTYRLALLQRKQWLLTTLGLRVYHKLRALAPLKRKQQHLLFSNKV
eukprot:gene1021-610_t